VRRPRAEMGCPTPHKKEEKYDYIFGILAIDAFFGKSVFLFTW
jgi:hypothetical protein